VSGATRWRVGVVALTVATASGAGPGAAGEADAWSAALLEQARQSDRPVLLVVNDASCDACRAAESAARADASVWGRLERDFVWVRNDRVSRPDLADVYGLAVRELGGGEGFPLLVAVTPDATPYLGRAGAEAFERAAFERFASEAVAGFRTARSGLDARARTVRDALVAAQTPSAPKGPLDPAVLDAAARSIVGWSDLARTDAPLPHAAIRFLLAEQERARRPELLQLASSAADLRIARPVPAGAASADEALALETWTLLFAASGSPSHRTEAVRAAERLLALRDANGLWPAGRGDARVVAQTCGLAIAALARSARTLGRENDRDAAVRAASAVRARLGEPVALARLEGGPAGPAFLDDHAALLDGLLELYETTDDVRWRGEAQAVAEAAIGRFSDVGGGGFFLTDAAHGPLPVRVKHAFDGSLPSANGTLARALMRLSRVTGEPRYAELGRRTVEAFLGDLQRAPRGMLTLAEAAGRVLGPGAARIGPAGATTAAFRLPSRETRGPVTLEVRAPSPWRAGATVEASLTLSVANGSFVVARSGGALDLAGLAVSVPLEGARSVAPRLPEPLTRSVSWSAQPLAVYASATTIPIAVTLSPRAVPGDRPLRVRVLFQSCNDARCATPETVTLEVPIRIEAAR
jgi:uncharacterized protein YyaL (SSP411 family)